MFRHALRNVLNPLVTIVALDLPALLGGTVIIEHIFAWPGMGTLAVESVFGRDYPGDHGNHPARCGDGGCQQPAGRSDLRGHRSAHQILMTGRRHAVSNALTRRPGHRRHRRIASAGVEPSARRAPAAIRCLAPVSASPPRALRQFGAACARPRLVGGAWITQDPYDHRSSRVSEGAIRGASAWHRFRWARRPESIAPCRARLALGRSGRVSIYAAIGIVLGGLSGFYGGWVDSLIMRFADMVLSFPSLIVIITIVSSSARVSTTSCSSSAPWVGRRSRGWCGEMFSPCARKDFVVAARATRRRNRRIIFRHVLPNAIAPVIVAASFGMAQAILLEAGLSFLGLGVQPPTPSWGNMLTDAQSITVLRSMTWLWLPPGLMIAVTVLTINFIGDGFAMRSIHGPSGKIGRGGQWGFTSV